jgi:hypothetical protein
MRKALAAFAFAPLLLCACPAMHQAPPARAQEAASELNLNAKFGRMELAAERVAPKARDAFFETRKTWGGKIRVADYELQGLKMKGEADAEIFVRVSWFRIDEGDLRGTTIRQKWHDFKGDWKLVEEARLDGDVGLLGEAIERMAPSTAPRHAQFPTIRIGTAGPGTTLEELPQAPAATTTTTSATVPTAPSNEAVGVAGKR